ncbi:hypothetical protein CCAX7_20980 [Capsulimonas corticalis]|uniref:Uncharacterized protein n=1 Tax=Capsulimonas corticalis TaxID=2219043 RepID=A0A402D1U5_9BACT|nr:hypothetical protein CCAX7_20980 [Capsulimonas corticalis]
MEIVLVGVCAVLAALFFYLQIIIVRDAFKESLWKGVLSFFFFPYWMAYALYEFNHRDRVKIFLIASACGIIGVPGMLWVLIIFLTRGG